MSFSRKFKLLIAAATVVAVAGCGDVAGKQLAAKLLKRGADSASPAINIEEFLNRTTGPVALLVVEKIKASTLLQQLASNGRYRSFFSPDGQSLTFVRGILTSTRGVGNDLMSASIDPSIALITGRREGKATRIMRYLGGEGQTVTLTFDCEIQPRQMEKLESGRINTMTQVVTESCSDGTREFTNVYMVSRSGEVLHSRQWVNSVGEGVVIQMLRQ